MGYVFVPTWCYIIIIHWKGKKRSCWADCYFLPSVSLRLWIDCHFGNVQRWVTQFNLFPVTVSKTSQFCHSWSPILLGFFVVFSCDDRVNVFSSILKLNSWMPGPTAIIDSVPALAQQCSAPGENENTGDTIWMHSDFFLSGLLWPLAEWFCTGLYSNSPLASLQFCHFWCRFEFFFSTVEFSCSWTELNSTRAIVLKMLFHWTAYFSSRTVHFRFEVFPFSTTILWISFVLSSLFEPSLGSSWYSVLECCSQFENKTQSLSASRHLGNSSHCLLKNMLWSIPRNTRLGLGTLDLGCAFDGFFFEVSSNFCGFLKWLKVTFLCFCWHCCYCYFYINQLNSGGFFCPARQESFWVWIDLISPDEMGHRSFVLLCIDSLLMPARHSTPGLAQM